jgi:transposase
MASYKQSDYEGLRRRCVELSQSGWKQLAIAQAFGLTQGWVSRTLTKYRQLGMDALQEGKRTGAPTRLSSQQLTELVDQLRKGPEHHGFQGALWTRPRVNEVIKKVGWSRQKPQTKARQQNTQTVTHWQQERLPELKKSAD